MSIPPAIIYVNSDLNDILKNTLSSQLSINETMDGYEFDARMIADPNYAINIHLNKLRVLVIRSDFQNMSNRSIADIVIFVKQGMATILKSNFGPPGLTVPVARLNIYQLLRYNQSSDVVILPNYSPPPTPKNTCNCPPNTGPGGIVGLELRAGDSSGVNLANCDNEYNNPDFINRK